MNHAQQELLARIYPFIVLSRLAFIWDVLAAVVNNTVNPGFPVRFGLGLFQIAHFAAHISEVAQHFVQALQFGDGQILVFRNFEFK